MTRLPTSAVLVPQSPSCLNTWLFKGASGGPGGLGAEPGASFALAPGPPCLCPQDGSAAQIPRSHPQLRKRIPQLHGVHRVVMTSSARECLYLCVCLCVERVFVDPHS